MMAEYHGCPGVHESPCLATLFGRRDSEPFFSPVGGNNDVVRSFFQGRNRFHDFIGFQPSDSARFFIRKATRAGRFVGNPDKCGPYAVRLDDRRPEGFPSVAPGAAKFDIQPRQQIDDSLEAFVHGIEHMVVGKGYDSDSGLLQGRNLRLGRYDAGFCRHSFYPRQGAFEIAEHNIAGKQEVL